MPKVPAGPPEAPCIIDEELFEPVKMIVEEAADRVRPVDTFTVQAVAAVEDKVSVEAPSVRARVLELLLRKANHAQVCPLVLSVPVVSVTAPTTVEPTPE